MDLGFTHITITNNQRFWKGVHAVLLFILTMLLNVAGGTVASSVYENFRCDSVGTVLLSCLLGPLAGITAGYIYDVFMSIGDITHFYYAILSIITGYLVSYFYEKGYFGSIKKMLLTVWPTMFLIHGIGGEFLTKYLNNFEIQTQTNYPAVSFVTNAFGGSPYLWGYPVNVAIEAVEKLIVLLVAYFILKAIPERIMKESDRNLNVKLRHTSIIRHKVTLITFVTSCVIAFATLIYTFMEFAHSLRELDGMIPMSLLTDEYISVMRQQQMVFAARVFCVVVGVEILLAFFILYYYDYNIVFNITRMTRIMDSAMKEDANIRENTLAALRGMDVHTGDEIEELGQTFQSLIQELMDSMQREQAEKETITKMQTNIIATLADIIENRDLNTGEHVMRTSGYVEVVAKAMKARNLYPEILTDEYIQQLRISAPLHDIGKIRISDTILNKKGPLNREEYEIMKMHPIFGGEIIDQIEERIGAMPYFDIARDLTLYHHEWWDGSGYPFKKKGDEIPLAARIMAVCDVFDALSSERVYKKEFKVEDIIRIMKAERGTHFDPDVFDTFAETQNEILQIREKYRDEDHSKSGKETV